MGEYYTHRRDDGSELYVKLGTCESWYVREGEARLLRAFDAAAYEGNPSNWDWVFARDGRGAIFRFPWPDEDIPERLQDSFLGEQVEWICEQRMTHWDDRSDKRLLYVPWWLAAEHSSSLHGRTTTRVNPLGQAYAGGINVSVPCVTQLAVGSFSEPTQVAYRSSNTPAFVAYQVIGRRYREAGPYTVVSCSWCDAHHGLPAAWRGHVTDREGNREGGFLDRLEYASHIDLPVPEAAPF